MGIDDKLDQVQGRVEKTAGAATGNDRLEAEGEATENKGILNPGFDSKLCIG